MKKMAALILAVVCLVFCSLGSRGLAEEGKPEYILERMVILSRHGIRSPMSGSGSLLAEITPHAWFNWTSRPSELSLRGAVLETLMGQYFRLQLEEAGLIPENWQPKEGAARFYANAKQRTQATARYFSAGLLPVGQVPVEMHAEYDSMDPVFNPVLHFVTEEYARDVETQVAEAGGIRGLEGIHAGVKDALIRLMEVTDMEESEAYTSGKYGDLMSGETQLILTEGKEPGMEGAIRRGTSVADALILQYYEEADPEKYAFGHAVTEDDLRLIHSIADTYTEMLFGAPLVAPNLAHPLLREIRSELTAEGRKFSFLCGHDSNLCSVLAALGVEEYLLPDAVEQRTPIGVKLVMERWIREDGTAWIRTALVYQTPAQLRSMEQLTLENPPSEFPLRFEGVAVNEDGLMVEEDFLALFDRAIGTYEELLERYVPETEATDEAA